MMKSVRLLVALLFAFVFQMANAQQYTLTKTPQRIILNLTATPAESIAVTWRTVGQITKPDIQIAAPTAWTQFEMEAGIIEVKSSKIITDKGFEVFHHSAVMNGLKPNTRYIYRVGGDSIWSEWNQFSTARPESEPFTFTYFGDIQHDVKEFGSRILREAYRFSPKSDFWLFTGDLVDRAELDYQWDEFFSAASFIPSVIPSVFVAGNHEYADTIIAGKEEEFLAELWRSHITQPEGPIKGIEETVFSFDYQGVRFIVLNGNEKLQEQAQWLNGILANNPNLWTIVTIHQPIYSMSKGRDQQNSRNAFLPLFDKYAVDLVLQGHDHVYARTAKMKDGGVVKSKDNGTIYVTSNSGSDEYTPQSINTKYAVKLGNKSQLFQVISIRKNQLDFKSYTATGILNDSFKLSK